MTDGKGLDELLAAVRSDEMDIEDACAQAARLPLTSRLRDRIAFLQEMVGRMSGIDPDFEYAAARLCVCVAAALPVDDALRISCAFHLGRCHLVRDELEDAETQFAEATRLARAGGHKEMLASVLAQHASLLAQMQRSERARTLFSEALTIAAGTENTDVEAGVLMGLAQMESLSGGNLRDVEQRLRRALEIYRSTGTRQGEFDCLQLLVGLAEKHSSDVEQVQLLGEAIALSKREDMDPAGRALLLARLSAAQRRLRRPQNAQNSLRTALSLVTGKDEPQLEAFIASNLGAHLADDGKISEARAMFSRALEQAGEAGDEEGVSVAKQNLARLRSSPGGAVSNASAAVTTSVGTGGTGSAASRELQVLLGLAEEFGKSSSQYDSIVRRAPQPPSDSALVHEIGALALEKLEEWNTERPRPAFGLALVLQQWMPETADREQVFLLHQFLGAFGERSNNMQLAVHAYTVCMQAAQSLGQRDKYLASATNLGTALRRSGRTGEAMEAYRRAIDGIGERTSPSLAATVLTNAATAYTDAGRIDEAEQMQSRAVGLLKGVDGQELTLIITTINFAASYFRRGDLEKTEELMTEAMRLAREANVPSQEAVALGHIGLVRVRQGRTADAIRYLTQAATVAEFEKDLWNAQHWYRDLANVELTLGRTREAAGHAQKALGLSDLVQDRRSRAGCLLILGKCKVEDDTDSALATLEEAWNECMATGNPGLACEASLALDELWMRRAIGFKELKAQLLSTFAVPAGAEIVDPAAFAKSQDWLAKAGRSYGPFNPEPYRARILLHEANVQLLKKDAQRAVQLLREAIGLTSELLDLRGLHMQIGRILFRDLKQNNEALEQYELAISLHEKVADALPGTDRRAEFRDDFGLTLIEAAECAVATGSLGRALQLSDLARAPELRRAQMLRDPRESSILDVGRIEAELAARPDVALIVMNPGAENTTMLVIGARPGGVNAVKVDGFGQLDLARLWLSFQASEANGDASALDAMQLLEEACGEIGDRLMRPLAEALQGVSVSEIVLVPHSLLWCFPLHAAALNFQSRWLDRFLVRYSPSIAQALRSLKRAPSVGGVFEGFADPSGDLPLAGIEVATAKRLHGSAANIHAGSGATLAAIQHALSTAHWVHFAGHAQQALADPTATGLHLFDADGAGEGHAFLSLQRILQDTTPGNSPTIVLSGCETGASTPRLSGDLVSLAGGLLHAGAGAVISTYWKVLDVCACLVMSRFYAELEKGERSLAQALRTAMLWVRDLSEADICAHIEELIGRYGVPDADEEMTLDRFALRRSDVFPLRATHEWAGFSLVS